MEVTIASNHLGTDELVAIKAIALIVASAVATEQIDLDDAVPYHAIFVPAFGIVGGPDTVKFLLGQLFLLIFKLAVVAVAAASCKREQGD